MQDLKGNVEKKDTRGKEERSTRRDGTRGEEDYPVFTSFMFLRCLGRMKRRERVDRIPEESVFLHYLLFSVFVLVVSNADRYGITVDY